MIDTTINIGNIIQLGAFIAAAVYFVWKLEGRLTLLQSSQDQSHKRLDKIDQELEQLSKITIEIARQEVRMDSQDKRIQELSLRINEQVSKFAEAVQVLSSTVRTSRRLK